MKVKILALLLVLCTLFSLCACDVRGKLIVLDAYKPETLYNAYYDFAEGKRIIRFPLNEEHPKVRAIITNKVGVYAKTLDIFVVNESRFDIKIHGYAYVTTDLEKDNTCQAIYYNQQKHVSNSTYEIRIDTMHNSYLSYELLSSSGLIAAKESLMAFIFFKYEDTEYVGGFRTDGNFIYWPIQQTLKDTNEPGYTIEVTTTPSTTTPSPTQATTAEDQSMKIPSAIATTKKATTTSKDAVVQRDIIGHE